MQTIPDDPQQEGKPAKLLNNGYILSYASKERGCTKYNKKKGDATGQEYKYSG